MTDVATLATGLGTALHSAGLPVGPDRCERLARALTVLDARTVADLRACALATMVSDPAHVPVFEQVFAALFGGPSPFGELTDQVLRRGDQQEEPPPSASELQVPAGLPGGTLPQVTETLSGDGTGSEAEVPGVFRVASGLERLRGRDFAQLSPAELRQLVTLMRELTLAIPPRRTRRYRRAREGKRPDFRSTLRQARRSGGEVVRLARRAPRTKDRRLVVLCDISGSMEPYARALLLLLYFLSAGTLNRPEVFSFATRLTRLTPTLAAATPDTLLAKAGEAAPDWSGGTRIGAALKEFSDRHGSRGMARGAVVLIISDGWETGDPRLLGAQMARLRRIAHRIVWANPRTQSPRYRPEVGGMAAAWPYCDVVVSAHNLDALPDLLAALGSARSPAATRADATRR